MSDNPRIFAVDDEPDIVELKGYDLRKEGFAVSIARDGEEALKNIITGDFSG